MKKVDQIRDQTKGQSSDLNFHSLFLSFLSHCSRRKGRRGFVTMTALSFPNTSFEEDLDQLFGEFASRDAQDASELERDLQVKQSDCIDQWFNDLDAMASELAQRGSEAFGPASPLPNEDPEKERLKKIDILLTEFQYNVRDEDGAIEIVKDHKEKEERKKKKEGKGDQGAMKRTVMTEKEFERWFQLMSFIILDNNQKESLVAKAIFLLGVLFRSQETMIEKHLLNPSSPDRDLASCLAVFCLDETKSPTIRALSIECLSRLLSSSLLLFQRINEPSKAMEDDPNRSLSGMKRKREDEDCLGDSFIFKIGWESIVLNQSHQIQLAGQMFLLHVGRWETKDDQSSKRFVAGLVQQLERHVSHSSRPEELIKIADFVLKLTSDPFLAVSVLKESALLRLLLENTKSQPHHRDLIQRLCEVLQIIPFDLLSTLLSESVSSSPSSLIREWMFSIWSAPSSETISMIVLKTLVNIKWTSTQDSQKAIETFSLFWERVIHLLLQDTNDCSQVDHSNVEIESIELSCIEKIVSDLSFDRLSFVFSQLIEIFVSSFPVFDRELWREFESKELNPKKLVLILDSRLSRESHRVVHRMCHLFSHHLLLLSIDPTFIEPEEMFKLLSLLKNRAIDHISHPIIFSDCLSCFLKFVTPLLDSHPNILKQMWEDMLFLITKEPPSCLAVVENVLEFMESLLSSFGASFHTSLLPALEWCQQTLEKRVDHSLLPLFIGLMSRLISVSLQTNPSDRSCIPLDLSHKLCAWMNADDEAVRNAALKGSLISFIEALSLSLDRETLLVSVGEAINKMIRNEIDWEVQESWFLLIKHLCQKHIDLVVLMRLFDPTTFDLVCCPSFSSLLFLFAPS